LSNLTLSEVATQLTTYAPAEIQAFLSDINTASTIAEHISKHINQLNGDMVKAWKAMTDAANIRTAFARDYLLLQKIKNIRIDNTKSAAFNYGTIGNFQQFLNTYNTVNCNTCPKPAAGSDPDIFGKLTDILDNTLGQYQKHQNTPNFIGFYRGKPFAKDARNKRDGGQFMLRVMANDARTSSVTNIDQQFDSIFPQVQGNYEFDMYTGNQTDNGLWFIECKSTDELPADMGQLTAYFSAIRNISNLEYIFNTKKAGTAPQAKEAIQKQLYNGTALTTMGSTLFNTIWANTALRENMFKDDGIDFTQPDNIIRPIGLVKFQEKVNSILNPFYSFIKVK